MSGLHFLYSASVDGLVFVWKINEVKGEEDKPQIAEKVLLAIQIVGDGKSVHPRLCWHPHKQVTVNLEFVCIAGFGLFGVAKFYFD